MFSKVLFLFYNFLIIYFCLEGKTPKRPSLLLKYLKNSLDEELNDPSTHCLILLKTLFGLNTYWWALFDDDENSVPPSLHSSILPSQ